MKDKDVILKWIEKLKKNRVPFKFRHPIAWVTGVTKGKKQTA